MSGTGGAEGAADETFEKRIMSLIGTGEVGAANELHDSGEWTDLEMVVLSGTGGDAATAIHCTGQRWRWLPTASSWR